ncbi:alpha/beta fold hydrolase [Massilia endophytica]|uniref:alpha/beta fold hydrolase n=1 Tax=Massilia endophytica TaxID=2899220 RepID=UPI001E365A22|nr:alpha/beta hydrolase [Massilia endophytica]UGQ47683.1 alpha/beta hydrolase [Massilia endophytica]
MKRTFVSTLATLAFAAALPAHAATAFKAEVTGKGPAVILIPGLASSGEVWKGTTEHLCGPRQCHVLTLAGFAGQPAMDGPLLATAEKEIAEYIETNKLGKPVIIGHSLGGFLGMKLAADHPDKVGKLVIVDSLPALAATQLPTITREQMAQVAASTRDRLLSQDDAAYAAGLQRTATSMVSSPADIERVVGWGRISDRKAVANAMYEMTADDMRQDIARISAPTLVLGAYAGYKQFAPLPAIEAVYRGQYAQLKGVQIAIAENARHFIMFDDPAWMYDRVDQFLK